MSLFIIIIYLFLMYPPQSSADVNHTNYTDYKQCLSCHPRALPTHRRDVTTNVPPGWPVGPDGRLVCLTCHDCSSGVCKLRKKKPELCKSCHDCTQGMACMIQSAHLGNSRDIETQMNDCLACHDGNQAKLAGADGHPINVLYLEKTGFNHLRDRRIVIVNGKVTCISCHNPYRNTNERLVKSNQNSSLCLTCHNK